MNDIIIISAAGLLAGAMNAAAGGGSFVSVPSLIFAGVPSVSANMSSTIALYPGSITSMWVYRKYLRTIGNVSNKTLILTTLVGGFVGAMLLLLTPNSSFNKIIPWLLLFGTLAFAFGRRIGELLQKHYQPSTTAFLLAQFLLGIYGGYFGGAVGIMMMAVWSVFGETDVKVMNALKVVLVAAANTVAAICFATIGKVAWPETWVMLVAATLGGYLGAHLILKLPSSLIRIGINVINFSITAIFFYLKVLS